MQSNNSKVNKEVDKLVKCLRTTINWYSKTDVNRIELDKIHQNITWFILKKLETEGRFIQLNKMKWDSNDKLLEWFRSNQTDWYDPMTGKHSSEYKKGWIAPIPGDILAYQGAGKIPLFEHFGIYVGNIQGTGIMVEVRTGDIIEEYGHINMLCLKEVSGFTKFPLRIIQTIKYNSKLDRWIDSRVYTRQVCLWTALKTLKMGWKYELLVRGHVKDQCCQVYVTSLLFSKPRTVQLWNLFTILTWVIYYWFYKKL